MSTLRPIVIPPLSPIRRVIGILVAVATAILLVAYTLGAWNPWHNVFLRTRFGDPTLGVPVVVAMAIVTGYILMPVRNEAAQHRRVVIRMILFGLLALSLIVFGFVKTIGVFTYRSTIVAHSADGTRTAALVTVEGGRQLHIFTGTGLAMRDAGNLGVPCGATTVTFQGNDLVLVSTYYGDFRLRIDPTTGHPITVIGPTCSG